VDYGLDVAQHQLDWDELLRRVRLAEDAGLAGAWIFDHFRPLYGDRNGPCLEAWTLLAALAAATERIRLGTLVTGTTYRHPALLAMEAVTVDHVSAGRLDIGLGAAWEEREHRAFGFDFPAARDRVRRLEETVTVIRRLTTEAGVDLDGEHVTLRDATYTPRPVQRPHPPIWIGGRGRQLMLPLIARVADVWHADAGVEQLRELSALLDEHAERAGRDPGEIRRASNLDLSQDRDAVRADAEARAELGFSYLIASWPSEGEARLTEFLEQVLPDLP
jgi:F420-dependent oxidoreductase-like protein